MLRADVDYILVVGEELSLAANELSVGIEAINLSVFWLHIVLKRVRVIIFPVFAEWVALEVVAQEESAHVRMVEELDAVEVKHFTLKQLCHLPEVANSRDDIIVFPYPLCNHLHACALLGVGILKNVDTSQTFLGSEIFANDGHEIVKMLLLLQVCHFLGKLVKVKNEVVQFHLPSSCSFLMFFTKSGTSPTTAGFFHPAAIASLESPNSRSSLVCLWLAPPKNLSTLTLRCSCIIP